MPKKFRDPNRLTITIQDAFKQGYAEGQNSVQEQSITDADVALADSALILQHQPGYYRMGFHTRTRYWCRFKWTAGDWANHYVFASANDLTTAIQECNHNVDKCESGKLKPNLDGGYKK